MIAGSWRSLHDLPVLAGHDEKRLPRVLSLILTVKHTQSKMVQLQLNDLPVEILTQIIKCVSLPSPLTLQIHPIFTEKNPAAASGPTQAGHALLGM